MWRAPLSAFGSCAKVTSASQRQRASVSSFGKWAPQRTAGSIKLECVQVNKQAARNCLSVVIMMCVILSLVLPKIMLCVVFHLSLIAAFTYT